MHHLQTDQDLVKYIKQTNQYEQLVYTIIIYIIELEIAQNTSVI